MRNLLLLAIGCLALIFSPAALAQQAINNDLADTVLKSIKQNRDKVTAGSIQWSTRLIKNNGPQAGVTETHGQHEMWWQGERIATRSWEQRPVPSEKDPGRPVIRWRGRWTVFDGNEFRAAPYNKQTSRIDEQNAVVLPQKEYEPGESWFDVSRLHWDLDYPQMAASMAALQQKAQWSLGEPQRPQDKPPVLLTISAGGTRLVHTFDPAKAYSMTNVDMWDAKGVLRGQTRISYAQVADGAWFPTKVEEYSYNRQVMILHKLSELDLKTSSFNDPSRLPREMFNLSPVPPPSHTATPA